MINEDALKHSYAQFKETGYTDDYETFKNLLATNNDALEHAFNMFKETGYTDGMDTFKGMMLGDGTTEEEVVVEGDSESPKKKDSTESSLEDGTSDSEGLSELPENWDELSVEERRKAMSASLGIDPNAPNPFDEPILLTLVHSIIVRLMLKVLKLQ